MKAIGLVLFLAVVGLAAACGGKDKPPLTPDTDNGMGLGDGGAGDTPSNTPNPSEPSTPK